ncbi:MAG: class I SAM-dependent methyltransferase [Bacteroidetes bacterium]|nr:class I SAM-dependent methyltransferase [Bacteroidota bacterium]
MEIIHKIYSVFRKYGILFIIKHFYYELYYDYKLGISTIREKQLKSLSIDSKNKTQGEKYQPSSYYKLNKIFQRFSIQLENQTILDLGCGKGRFLFYSAFHGARKAIGIEFAKELYNIAEHNKVRFLQKNTKIKTDINIILSDVVDYNIDKEVTLIFLFNPFKEKVTEKIIENINTSLKQFPRKIQIIYLNPLHSFLFDQHFILQSGYNKDFNIPIRIYSNF